jgi:nuclease HARBI1
VNNFPADLLRKLAAAYAVAVANKSGALQNCVGFIDGTKIQIARPPGTMQRATYSGHKRFNCLKFQVISAPDGLALRFAGPVEGRRHDMAIFSESNIEDDLAAHLSIDGRQYCIYGDSAFVLREYLIVGFDGTGITPAQAAFNKAMSKSRVTVKWIFKDIKKYWTHAAFPRKLALSRKPVGVLYGTSIILWNLRCCLYGSPTSRFFSCPPPTLANYIGLVED